MCLACLVPRKAICLSQGWQKKDRPLAKILLARLPYMHASAKLLWAPSLWLSSNRGKRQYRSDKASPKRTASTSIDANSVLWQVNARPYEEWGIQQEMRQNEGVGVLLTSKGHVHAEQTQTNKCLMVLQKKRKKPTFPLNQTLKQAKQKSQPLKPIPLQCVWSAFVVAYFPKMPFGQRSFIIFFF